MNIELEAWLLVSFFAVSFDPSRVDSHHDHSLQLLHILIIVDIIHQGLGTLVIDVESLLGKDLSNNDLRISTILEYDAIFEKWPARGNVL